MESPSPIPSKATDAERIVAGARRHFLALGFRSVTMADLAAELGMSKKTLYTHFASKASLLSAVIDHKLSEAEAELAKAVRQPLPFAAKLQRLLTETRAQMGEIQPPFVRDMAREEPELFARVQARRGTMIQRSFGLLLEEGRQSGTVRKDVPVRVLVEMLIGAVDSVVVPAKVEALGITPKTAFGHILAVFLEGALIRKGQTS